MTTRREVPQGAVCWLDLWTSDVAGSRHFYCDLFGWSAAEPSEEFGGYWMFLREGVPVAGGMGDMGDLKANNTWKVYLNAHDINDVVAKGQERGAHFFMPPMPVADLGIQTVFTDSTGAQLGAWQALSFPGFATTDEHATPCWFELNARDFSSAISFYTSVFALETKAVADSEDLRYTTLLAQGHEVAGILDASTRLPEGAPSNWVVYWQVDDIDEAVARVRELGGSVHDGPSDSPFGRIATVADPTGSLFKLRSLPAS